MTRKSEGTALLEI